MDDFTQFTLIAIIIILLLSIALVYVDSLAADRCENKGGYWKFADGCFYKIDGSYVKGYFTEINNERVFFES